MIILCIYGRQKGICLVMMICLELWSQGMEEMQFAVSHPSLAETLVTQQTCGQAAR